ncbi:MAG: 4-hydroxy-tetrahydrodipicolinate reductase [Micrococcales bacterium]|nr:4-hydroxy-tetrahydrodipicolinate reductase [Micrococcales bacterium]
MGIRVAVVGATGRMGKLAVELVEAAQDLELHATLDSKSELSEAIGADVIFEATNLEASKSVLDFAINQKINIVIATSGWTENSIGSATKVVTDSSVVLVPNFSVGSVLGSKFAAEAAKYFDSIEIVETHHAGKKDSPSGTATRTAELISASRKESGKEVGLVPGVGQEARGQVVAGIPIHSLRLHSASAKQEVLLAGDQELLTISHVATSVQAYAQGILQAIRFANSTQGLTVGLDKVLGI